MSDYLKSVLSEYGLGAKEADEKDPSADYRDSVLKEYGLKEYEPQKRTVLGAANDYVIEFSNAVANLPKAALDLAVPGSEASKAIGDFIKMGEEKQSDTVKAAKAKLSKSMQSGDTLEEIKGAGAFVAENPLLAASMAAGSFVGPGFAIKGGKALAGAAGLGTKGTTAAGTAAGSLAGGVLGGGDAAGSAYEMVMNSPSLQDLPLEERERMATQAAREASVPAFGVGAAAGLFGAEAALAKGISGGVIKTAAKEFGSEFIEEGATALSANVAAGQFAPEIKPFQGVAGAATLGGILGGTTGAGVGLLTRSQSGSILTDANDIGTEKNTESGAINKAIDSQTAAPTIDVNVSQKLAQVTTGAEQAQQVAADAAAQQQKDQELLAQQQAELAAVNEQRQATYAKYGGETVAISPTKNVYKFQGKVYFTENQLNQAVDKFVATEKEKSPTQLAVEEAYLQANALTGGKALNPNSLAKAVSQYVEQAESLEEVLARVQLDLDNALKSVKSQQQLAKVEPIHALRDELAGIPAEQRVPTIDLLPKGQLDGKQKQSDAGVRAVSEQGGATQRDGDRAGLLQPSSVQPVQPGSIIEGQTSQQIGQPTTGGVRISPVVSTTGGPSVQSGQDALQGKGQGQVNEQGQIQTPSQEGRDSVPGQDVEGSRTAAETAQDRAESVVSEVVNSIIEAIVKRTGRMSAKNLASLKEFMYYDFFQVASKDKEGLSVKELAEMYKVSSDTIDGWRKIAGKFFDENRGVIQSKILEGIAAQGTTLEQLKLDLQAVRNAKQGDVVILEEGQSLAEATTKDDEQAAKGEIKEVQATDQELGMEESVLDERDVRGEDTGISVSTGRVQQSIQEQNKPEETINAQIKRKLEEYNKALEDGNEEAEAKLIAEIDELTKEAKKVDTKRVAKSTAIAEDKAPKKKQPKERKKRAVQKPSAEKVPVREGTGSSEGVRKEDTKKRKVASEGIGLTEEEKRQNEVEAQELADKKKYEARQKEIEAEEKDLGAYLADEGVDNENAYPVKMGEAGYWSRMLASQENAYNMRKEELEAKLKKEGSSLIAVKEERAWNSLPVPIQHEQLSPQAKADWASAVKNGKTNLAAANKVYEENIESIQGQIADDSKTIDGKDLITEVGEEKQRLLLTDQTNKLTEAQNERLEKHYGAKRDSDEFFQKLREDVLNYVNKGAESVAGVIRDIIKQIANGVMAMAVVFNPQFMGQQSTVVFPTVTTEIVQAKVPTSVETRMSESGKKAYATLLPTLQKEMKEQNKYFTIVDKPTSTVFVFNPDGTLMDARIVLLGKATGDFYVGKTDFAQNRITPAGLFKVAAEKGSATYDGKTVYTVGNVAEGWNAVFMHPVYLKESDAQARINALATGKNTRLSHGCINGPLDFMAKIDNKQMDNSHVFIVPDNQAAVNDFITNKVSNEDLTRVTITPATKNVPGKTTIKTAGQVVVGKEEKTAPQTKQTIKLDAKTRASLTFANTDVMTSSSVTENLSVATASFDDLANTFPGIASMKATYERMNMPQAINAVEQWMVTDSPVTWDAIITLHEGKVTVIVNQNVFSDSTVAASAASHEIGHAIDYAITHSGLYSADPRMNIRIGSDGIVRGMGTVAKELVSLYNSDSNWKVLLKYPLNRTAHADLDAEAIRQEIFAQIWSYMTNANGQAYIKQTAPETYAFMQEVVNDVSSQTYGEAQRKVLGTSQQTQTAQQRQTDTGTFGRPERIIGRARETRQTANINKLPKPLQGPVSEITATIRDLARRGLTYLAFTEDLARIASKYVKSATDYVKLVREQQAVKTKYERRVDLILQQYDKLNAKLRGTGPGTVNAFLKKSTMDGKWAFDPGYLKKAPDIDPVLEAEFKALPKDAQDVVKAVFKHGHDTLQDMKRGVIDNINSEYDALIKAARDANDMIEVASLEQKKAASLKDYSTLMAVRAGKPYAPLKRFGNFVVVAKSNAYLQAEKDAKDKNKTPEQRKEAQAKIRELEKNEADYYVTFAETKREGRKIEEQLLSEGYGYVSEAFEKDSGTQDVYGGRDVQNVFYRLRNLANDSMDESGSAKTSQAINRLIADLHLTLLAEQSARQSERRRKNVAGAEDDMMRSFATQGLATAHFIATLHNSGKIYDTLQQMRQDADAQKPGRDIRREYYNEFMRRHALGLSYEPSPVINKALGVTSFWMLLTNPAYYLQNMTQPFMMSLPYVAGKHDYNQAWGEFTTAYKQIFNMIKNEGLSEESYSKLPADVREAIETLVNNGRIDISLDQDLGRWRDSEGSKAELAGKAIEKLRKVAQDIESVNRVATAVAAYRLEIKAGRTKEQAVAYADEVILRTHGDYSGFNAPRITRQGLGRIATQFRKFQLIQISLMAKLIKDSFAGASVNEKRIARRALGFTLSHTLAVGGVMGFPGFAAIAWVMGAAFGDDDEPDNPELTLRKMIGDKALADVILKGAPKFAGVDLSGKLGMGQMLSILPYTDTDLSRAGIAQAGYALLTGATGSLVQRAGEGVALMADGEYYKGLERLSPAALSQSMKAARFGLMDGVTLKNGDVVIKPEDIDFLDMLSVAIGLPSNKITDRTFVQGAAIDTEKFYKDRTGEIKRDYVKAFNAKDTAGMAKARQEWQEMQEAKRRNKLKTQPLSDLLRAPQEQKKREAGVVGGVQTTKSNREYMKQISKI